MLEILLIRPGATDYDAQGRIQGSLDIPLSQRGREEVAAMIEALRPRGLTAVYASACQAAQETAEALGHALGLRVKSLEKLRNLDHGLWQGMRIAEVKQKHPKVYRQWQDNPRTVCPPGGETVGAAMERVGGAMAKLLKKHTEGVVGLVAPEPLASLVRCHLRGGDIGPPWRERNGEPQWETILPEPAPAGA